MVVSKELHVVYHPFTQHECEVSIQGQTSPRCIYTETTIDRSEEALACILVKIFRVSFRRTTVRLSPNEVTIGGVNTYTYRQEVSNTLTNLIYKRATREFPLWNAVEELRDLISIVREVTINVNVQVVPVAYSINIELNLDTVVNHRTDVQRLAAETGRVRQRRVHQHVFRATVVVVYFKIQAIEEARRDTYRRLDLCFPSEVLVLRSCEAPTVRTIVQYLTRLRQCVIVADTLRVTRRTHAGLKLEVSEPFDIFQEVFALHIPHKTTRSKHCRAVVRTEARAAVVTYCYVEEVLVH